MSTARRIYFLAGLPRSGSTLLANILAQHPQIHVTPTSGVVDMLVQVRNGWDRNDAFQAMERKLSEQIKGTVLRAMLQAYFAHVDRPVCIDKNRYWAEFLEMGAELVGGRAVGRAYNAIRDAVTRGWKDRMHFIDYDELTRRPKAVMEGIYQFLGEDGHEHDFERVEQVTFEDDFVYGFKDLHVIRAKVEPQPPQWPMVYDDAVFRSNAWKNVENVAQFWKLYLKGGKA